VRDTNPHSSAFGFRYGSTVERVYDVAIWALLSRSKLNTRVMRPRVDMSFAACNRQRIIFLAKFGPIVYDEFVFTHHDLIAIHGC
jgi:hypothetical protein